MLSRIIGLAFDGSLDPTGAGRGRFEVAKEQAVYGVEEEQAIHPANKELLQVRATDGDLAHVGGAHRRIALDQVKQRDTAASQQVGRIVSPEANR